MEKQIISILTPCFNEEDNVRTCASEVARVMSEELPNYDYEHIFCDNASTDATVAILRELTESDPHVKVVVNSRNVGPLLNTFNGLKYVSGDLVVPMIPADIQDPPSALPSMVRAMTPDIDVVYGVRRNRKDAPHLAIARSVYYALIKVAGAGKAPPSHAGEFLLARRPVIDAVAAAGSRQSYVRGLVAQTEPRYAAVEYDWGVREHGKSRNSLLALVDQALTGLITTAQSPMRIALPLGFVVAMLGILYAIVNVVAFTFGNAHASPGIATIIVGLFLFGGLQLVILGIIGEYVVSIHRAVNPPPPVFERDRINL